MFEQTFAESLSNDKNIYYQSDFSVVTVYDDNLFLRNDYDILSSGQRNYLLNFFKLFGLTQKTGKLLSDGTFNVHFPKPSHALALSAYQPQFNQPAIYDVYAVTPSTYAEVIFYQSLSNGEDWGYNQLKQLIETCPYNIELIMELSKRTPIELLTQKLMPSLMEYQKQVIKDKFPRKKPL